MEGHFIFCLDTNQCSCIILIHQPGSLRKILLCKYLQMPSIPLKSVLLYDLTLLIAAVVPEQAQKFIQI